MTGISVIYTTHRPQPHFDWFADSLARQLDDGETEVIVVDGLLTPARVAELEHTVAGRFAFRHLRPKPTPYNGPYRLTRNEYFAASSARNTGIALARMPYVLFIDDCSVLMPGYWPEAQRAARHGYIVSGAGQRHVSMVVERGVLLSSRLVEGGIRTAQDPRWKQGDDTRLVRLGDDQLTGCSFGAPRSLLLGVNGLDELCDSVGGEDAQLGIRFGLAGERIYYSRRMLVVMDEEVHGGLAMRSRDHDTTSGETYMQRLGAFGVGRRSVSGGWRPWNMILDITYGLRSSWTAGNDYRLSDLHDEADMLRLVDRFPRTHWFDGRPLAEM